MARFGLIWSHLVGLILLVWSGLYGHFHWSDVLGLFFINYF